MVTPSPGRGRVVELRGRRRELGFLDRLIGAVRAGESRALVLSGEAGVGKTALLDYVAGHAPGCRVVRATGVQSEMELAFAGLQQLCKPLLDHLDRLPGPQRAALQTAFGLSAGPAPDRFLVGLAVLGLLSDAAGEQPLICLVDDEHWLDDASAQALGSRRAAWKRNRWAWSSRRATRRAMWRGWRSWWSRACGRTMRGRCWIRC